MLHRRTLFTALAGLGLGSALPACAAEADDLAGILARSTSPALAGAVVDATGLKHIAFAGLRRQSGPDPVGRDDLWHLGSNTKAMTAALYGRLVEQGRARWGATLPQLFPGLKVDAAFSAVTVEQLMGHRAGILDGPVVQGSFLMMAHGDKRPVAVQRAELAARLLAAPPAGPVGTFAYGNLNYVLLGAAIEAITSQSWEDAVTTRLFKPLGMTGAGFGAPKGAAPWGHRRAGGLIGPLTPVDPAGLADNPAILGPAGRAHMSLADYARFLRLFLSDGGGVLKPDTVRRLITPAPGEGRPYACGWGVGEQSWAGGKVLAHEGSNTLWHAVTVVAPTRKLAFVGVSNAPPDAAAREVVSLLRKRFAPG